ncbi:hypothetical protein Ga0100231_005070 [Opitutaceae bacterium TAV4]|uniref:hypothetical protein n=1 Tax=Geminisphaera colitermitum TaxID=1148786 RepID=UPI000158C706|nr:hypothetical protein [Geminisphaera colitermitum]RRJ97288.1 hypothetical protein Ga0100231_001645 [Opitutaceae bacterium TAV4]RRJ97832.1 hypothetical protein Ga0100231_005070 [Opitutaceae bacterium TAV4]RRK02365.1 hypothetical protein Ga0100230_004210 [Opitutaceae bacterium TAV3]
MYPKPRDDENRAQREREIHADFLEYQSLINDGPIVRPHRSPPLMSDSSITPKLDLASIINRLETDVLALESARDIVHYGGTCKKTFAEDIRAIIAHARRAEAAEALVAESQKALAFAASCIKSGEPWTDTCERVIGAALAKTPADMGAELRQLRELTDPNRAFVPKEDYDAILERVKKMDAYEHQSAERLGELSGINEALRARVSKLERDLAEDRDIAEAEAQIDSDEKKALNAELAKLRKDKARLDWLLSHGYGADTEAGRINLSVSTARDAIDAAMSAKEGA